MASQKLTFLKKIDPERAKEAVLEARRGGARHRPAAAEAGTGGAPPRRRRCMDKLAARIKANPGWVKEVARGHPAAS